MRVVIVGIGEVGHHLSAMLSRAGHDVTVVDKNAASLSDIDLELDVRVIHGSGSSAATLREAFHNGCDAFIAMTSDDAVNLVACSLAKALSKARTICRIHDQTIVDGFHLNYSLHFGVDLMLNPEGLCAIQLAKPIRNPARVAVEHLARGAIEVQRLELAAGSKWLGKPLRLLSLPAGVRIGYLHRGDFEDVPSADTELQEGDTIVLFGPPDELTRLQDKMGDRRNNHPLRVIILGGSETAVALIRLLNHPRFRIRVIEQNQQKCRLLAERFPHVTFICGDGRSMRLLLEEQIGHADFFIASTSMDETNVMTSAQAAALGSRNVQMVLNKSDYEEILQSLSGPLKLSQFVSPRLVTAQEVLRQLSDEPFYELFRFPGNAARIIEICVPVDSPCSGKQLRELGWPRHAVIVALLHQFQTKVPTADDRIIGGDHIIVITREENIPPVLALIKG